MSETPAPSQSHDERDVSLLRRAHVTGTAFLALFSIVGFAYYGLPFFYDFMVKDFGWSRALVTSGNAYSKVIVAIVFGFGAGWIVDRFGPKRLMIAGIIMAGGAVVGIGNVSSLGFFYFFYLFNALGYVCGGPLPNQVLLTRWFDRSRGKAMGIAYLGIGVGGAIVPQLADYLTKRLKPWATEHVTHSSVPWLSDYVARQPAWQLALTALGILMVAVALPPAFTVRENPPAPRKNQTHVDVAPVGSVFTRRSFYLLAIGSMCSIGAVGGTIQNLKLFLSLDQKMTQSEIAHVQSLILMSSIVGRLLMGWLADRFPKQRVMLLIYSIVATSIPLLYLSSSPTALWAFAVVFGIGLGGDYMIIPLMAAELFGLGVMGRVMGVVLTADGVAEALCPMGVAMIRDRTGSYAAGFLGLIVLAAVGAVAVSLLPLRRAARDVSATA